MIAPILAVLQEEAAGSGSAPLVGGLILGMGAIELGIAAYLGFVHRMPKATEQARKVLPLALMIAGLVTCVIGANILAVVVPT